MIGPLTQGAQDLINAIDDTTITTVVDASDNDFVSDNSAPLLGSFRGNKFTGPGPVFTVEAKQEINQPALENWDRIVGNPGQTTLHEVTEGYKGATISQQTGHSVGPATYADQLNERSIYTQAHTSVTKQSGVPTDHFFNAKGNEVYRQSDGSVPGAVRLEYRINGETFHHVPKRR